MQKKDVVSMPHIDPKIVDPKAAKYRAQLDARKSNEPAGGGPMPPVPDLRREPDEGAAMPMSAHAMRERAQRATANVKDLLDNPDSIFSGMQAPQPVVQGLTPMDLLPEQAKTDAAFREGSGSMYAVNQPHLATKYGIIRGGNFIPPQALSPNKNEKRHLSDQTVKGLQEVAKFQDLRQKAETGEFKAQQDSEKGPAGATARLGNMPGDNSAKPISEAERKDLKEAVRKMDDFDFDTFRQMVMKDLLNNEDQKNIIESRLKPMDLSDLIMEGSVAQEVIIVPDKFWIKFRSVSGQDDLAVKRLIMEESKAVQIDDRYYLDKFAFMTLTMGLESVNGNPLPTYKDGAGNFEEKTFWRKYEIVSKYNIHMLASLGVNYFWFDTRVRSLFVAEKIKNG